MLTKVSNDLIHHFLGKSDIKSIMKDPRIRQLFNSLQPSYQNSSIKTSNSHGSYPESSFIATSLSNKLSQRNNILTLRWTTVGNHKVQNILHIYTSTDSLPNTELLVRAISFITAYSDRPRKITIHLCLLPDKKILRKNQKKITPLNVNSGSNRFTSTESEICIFRREECIKVIFHEVLHGLRCSKLGSHKEITERLCVKYKLKSKDILIDESYAELWAKLINCAFISSLTNSSSKFQHFCTLIALEKEFSIYQANKIKQFVKKSSDKNLDKDTNVTAYYLVVGEIFTNLTDFLMTCGDNPYVRDHQKCLDYLYQLSILDKKKVTTNDKFYSTMRMSVSELSV
jgi:hypothetical protein